jgi:hypothetical protein
MHGNINSLYYIKTLVSTVVPRHLLTNNHSHLFQSNPLHARPLRATNLHAPNHTSTYRWPNDGPARAIWLNQRKMWHGPARLDALSSGPGTAR